jgi:hypothetical protein
MDRPADQLDDSDLTRNGISLVQQIQGVGDFVLLGRCVPHYVRVGGLARVFLDHR